MRNAGFVIGFIAALPLTAITLLLYVIPFQLLGWYTYVGWRSLEQYGKESKLGHAPVWKLSDSAPKALKSLWSHWGGHCVGTAVVLRNDPDSGKRNTIILVHELCHVEQVHRLGLLQPFAYAVSSLLAWIAGEEAYKTNVFEMAARRSAGQVVDPQSFVQGYALGSKQRSNG